MTRNMFIHVVRDCGRTSPPPQMFLLLHRPHFLRGPLSPPLVHKTHADLQGRSCHREKDFVEHLLHVRLAGGPVH